jgi:predicted MPP superfamily phosphohydrolase
MLSWILLAIAVAGLLCVAYGVAIERRAYRLVRYRLDILPAADGPESLSILHLSDLHFTTGDAKKRRFLAALPNVDVTVVTGDLLADPEAVETAVGAIRRVRGRLASWFVLGSNDYYVPSPINPLRYFVPGRRRRRRRLRNGRWREMTALLAADGWTDLTNVRGSMELGGLSVELLGLDDAHIYRHDMRVVPRAAPERFGIAVMHSPDTAPEAAACGYELIVAGHTHGGQVALPLAGALITNSVMPRRLASGLILIGGSWMSLSPGLGTSRFAPFRFLVPPEVAILELRRSPSSGEASAQEPATTVSNTRS